MPTPTHQHVAVVISGAYRTLPDCNATVVQHVIRANPGVDFSVFAHLTTEAMSKAEHEKAKRAVWSTFPCVAGVHFETNAAVSADVRDNLPGIDLLPRGRGTARGKAMNIVKMFRGIAMAQKLLDTGGSSRSGGGGCAAGATSRPYDLVLRLRPDLCFCGPLDLSPMLSRPGHHLWIPWWSTRVAWAFDQIAVGAPATMSAYAQAYATTVRRLVAERAELYPEAVMMAHIHTLTATTTTRQLRVLKSFRAGLARSMPRFHVEDPYTKLRADLLADHPAELPSLPPYECAAAAAPAGGVGGAAGGGKRHGAKGGGGKRRGRRLRLQRARAAATGTEGIVEEDDDSRDP